MQNYKKGEKIMKFEDVKKIRENPTMADVDNKELSKLIDIAIEKQIPKEPIMKALLIRTGTRGKEEVDRNYHCPCCDEMVGYFDLGKDVYYGKYCSECGQALDLGEEDG